NLSLYNSRSASDCVTPFRIDRQLFPYRFAGICVKRNQPSIESSGVNFALPNCYSAIYHVATGVGPPLLRHIRVVGPQQLASGGVQGEHLAPRAREVHRAVDDKRRGFLTAVGVEIEVPR